FGYSLLAGSLTLSIIILPVIIRTTEESLKVVPPSYREASLGLGATRFQTLYKVILPSAIPGILSGVILSMGRVIGESAALFLTAGTVYKIPTSIMSSGRTLTVHAFLETKEKGDIASAAAAGIVLIVMILILNLLAKFISKKFNKANY
ncbi:PstA family ABC transporter permease, partial [uncultured Clostridium sp.]